MIYLLISILSSTAIFILFRAFTTFRVITFPAIVINYLIACTLGMLLAGPDYPYLERASSPWFVGGLTIGVLFISLFYLMAFTSQRVGMSITSVATKMSLVIPVAWFMLTDPADVPTVIKVLAVLLAVVGVVLISSRTGEKFNWNYVLFPLLIFVGSGIIDLTLAHFSHLGTLTPQDQYFFTSAPFLTSTVIGIIVLIINALKGTFKINTPTIVAGITLGTVNFLSIFFLVKTFDAHLLDRSAIIPINNLGVVLCSALAGTLFFSERLSRLNKIGLALSILAILLLIADVLG